MYVPHTSVLLYSDYSTLPWRQFYQTPANECIETKFHHNKYTQHVGSCCTKRFAEFNSNCESYCSLEQLVALLCAVHEGKSASGTCHPKTKGYTRRYLYRPPDLLYCGGCTWTRISRQPIIIALPVSMNDIRMYCPRI